MAVFQTTPVEDCRAYSVWPRDREGSKFFQALRQNDLDEMWLCFKPRFITVQCAHVVADVTQGNETFCTD
jgi:hypothetical protein